MPLPLFPSALHELHAARESDGAVLGGLGLGLACRSSPVRPILWVRHATMARETGEACSAGLAEFGLDPARLVLVHAQDIQSGLQAGLEGARCSALGAVIVALWGETKAYDLTASRRLALAAKASGVPIFVLRVSAAPAPSAAQTRWLVHSSPSRALAANAPGNPAFELLLLRTRNGQEGLRYHLEWNRDAGEFITHFVNAGVEPALATSSQKHSSAPLSGAVVPVSFNRPGTPCDESSSQSRTG